MCRKKTMSRLTELLDEAVTVAIIGHIRPDGDDIGSCLGTYNYIIENYPDKKKVRVFLESKISKFNFMHGYDDICHKMDKDDRDYDLVICQDASTVDRLGDFSELLKTAKHSLCIDHHRTNDGFCEINDIRPNTSSTSEVVFELLDEEKISRNTAECLYTGIVHDTGVFQYTCMSPRTMEIAGRLLNKGVDPEFIVSYTFYQKTFNQIRAWGYAFQNAKLACDGRIIYSVFTWKDMKKFGISSIELDGISSELRLVDTADFAMLIYQDGQNSFKLSMRSNDKVDCSVIAQKHGGGGHIKASGCDMEGDPEEIAAVIINEVREQL